VKFHEFQVDRVWLQDKANGSDSLLGPRLFKRAGGMGS
jgi:hypothetical protein